MNFELDMPQAQALLNYLASRPWGEVNAFMALLLPQVEAQQREQAGQGAAQPGHVVQMPQRSTENTPCAGASS